ncbi:MAG: LuxR C-terminal-related transcriptional regulator [Verrucomicrobiota bacterium]|jgi:hypothetical protein
MVGRLEVVIKRTPVLAFLAEGFRCKEIAEHLGISFNTVREYVHSIYWKLHVTSRADAVLKHHATRLRPVRPPRPDNTAAQAAGFYPPRRSGSSTFDPLPLNRQRSNPSA